MNAIQHTPGPWNLPSHVADGDIGIVAGPRLLAMVTNDEDEPMADSEQLANARLMAAAPALLAALRVAIRVIEENDLDEAMAGEFEVLADAIAKCEGRA